MTEPDATNRTPNGASSENATAEAGPDATPKTGSQPPPASKKPAEEGELVAFAEAEVVPDPLEVAKADAAKYREQLLRTAADFDNFRKRARRENEDATRRGTEKALKELLPVFDNLERATTSAATAPDVKSVADGLKMIGRQFTNTLEKLGIKRIQAVGTPFDPSLHEAIQHVDSTEHPAGVIAVEVQAGYMIGEHLLRAAMVAVSKGAPEPADASAPSSAASGAPEASSPEATKPDADDTDPPTPVEPTESKPS